MATITAAMVKELRKITGAAIMDCKRALTECEANLEAAKELLRKKGQAIAHKKSSRETKEGAISIYLDDSKAGLVKMACETDFVAINNQFKEFIAEMAKYAAEVGIDNFAEKTTAKGLIKELITEAIAKLGENIVFVEGVDWVAEGDNVIGGYTHSNGKIGVVVEIESDKAADKKKLQMLAKDVAMHIAASQVEAIKEEDLDPSVLEKEKAFLIDQAKESGKAENIIEKMVSGRIQKFKKEICLMYQNFVKNPELTINQLLKNTGKELGVNLAVKRYFKAQL